MKHVVQLILLTIAGFILHELAHLVVAVGLGHEAILRINSVSVLTEPSIQDQILIAIAGPIMTIFLAVIGLIGAIRYRSMLAFNLLVAMAAQRTLAAAISVVAQPNDEYRVGEMLGIGPWTVFAFVLALLWLMVTYAAIKLRPGWMYALWAYVGLSIGIGMVVLGEPYLPEFRFGG